MESVPRIVVKRLQSPAADSHPDADLLTAFAERSLAGPERDHVAEHLARCGDCREVVSLALPPQVESQPVAHSSRDWFRWTLLRGSTSRWAAVAAGVVLIASIGTLQYHHQQRSELASNAPKSKPAIATPAPATLAPGMEAPGVEPSSQVAAAQARTEQARTQQPPTQNEKPATAHVQTELAGTKPAPSDGATFRRPATFGGTIGGPTVRDGFASAAGRSLNLAPPHDSIVAGAPVPTAAQQTVGGPSQTIAVQSETVQVATQSTAQNQMQVEDQLIQSKEAEQSPAYANRVEKAKPASPEGSLAMAPAPPLHTDPSLMKVWIAPRWTISTSGSLQRSFDRGQTWLDVNVAVDDSMRDRRVKTQMAAVEVQSAMTSDAQSGVQAKAQPESQPEAKKQVKFSNSEKQSAPSAPIVFRALSVSSNAAEVWAGGAGAALYHTVDAGNSWVRVLPSAASLVLTGDILSIQFSDPRNGIVTTSTAEVWITPDDGQTWQKQP
jgi:hypothetical protein